MKTARWFDIGTTTLVNWLKGKVPKNKRKKLATKVERLLKLGVFNRGEQAI